MRKLFVIKRDEIVLYLAVVQHANQVSKLPISYITQRKENLDNGERAHQMVVATVLFESVSN